MNKSFKKLLVVCGPTATGKTDFAINLASQINGEIINADSIQIYKGFDIGSAKGRLPKYDKLKSIKIENFKLSPFKLDNNIPGWAFDIVDCPYNFTLSDYLKVARKLINKIISRNKIPILVGGTGLYISAIVNNYLDVQVEPDFNLRKKLESLDVAKLQSLYIQKGGSLTQLNNSDKNNPRRLIRYIEKLMQKNFRHNNQEKKKAKDFESIIYYPLFDKEKLFKKLKMRIAHMLDNGFINEVENLLNNGCRYSKPINSTGYKEVVKFLDGEIPNLNSLKQEIFKAHKRYVKKQITWFEGKGRNLKLIKKVFDSNLV